MRRPDGQCLPLPFLPSSLGGKTAQHLSPILSFTSYSWELLQSSYLSMHKSGSDGWVVRAWWWTYKKLKIQTKAQGSFCLETCWTASFKRDQNLYVIANVLHKIGITLGNLKKNKGEEIIRQIKGARLILVFVIGKSESVSKLLRFFFSDVILLCIQTSLRKKKKKKRD